MTPMIELCPNCRKKHIYYEGNKVQCDCGCLFVIATLSERNEDVK